MCRQANAIRLAAFASRPLSLTFTKRFGWTPHPTGVRSCHAKRPGFRKWQHLTGLTRDKALRVRIQKALAIDYLRNEMRMLGAASVGPIDMGTQVMSVARVGLLHFCTKRTFANLLRSHRPMQRIARGRRVQTLFPVASRSRSFFADAIAPNSFLRKVPRRTWLPPMPRHASGLPSIHRVCPAGSGNNSGQQHQQARKLKSHAFPPE